MILLKPMAHINKQEDSCFMELSKLWYEAGFCDLQYITEIKTQNYADSTTIAESRFWFNDVGDILLYNNTLLDKLSDYTWNKALFANEVMKASKCSNWIFWPRWPSKYYKFQKENKYLDHDERKTLSVFIGNYTNPFRNVMWAQSVEFFRMGNVNNFQQDNMLLKYEEYLQKTQNSKFCLCLKGVGGKSLRECETMGLGTVPIFTPGVSTDYFEKLERDKHYLYVNNPEEVNKVLASCSKEKWQYMSEQCTQWFERNCSLRGSFDTTLKALESIP